MIGSGQKDHGRNSKCKGPEQRVHSPTKDQPVVTAVVQGGWSSACGAGGGCQTMKPEKQQGLALRGLRNAI